MKIWVISLPKRKSREPRGLETLFGHRLLEMYLLKLNTYTRKTLEQSSPSGLTAITSTSGIQTSISSLRSLINLTQDGIHISCNVFTPCWVALKTFFLRSVMVRGKESFKLPMSINLNSEYLKVKEVFSKDKGNDKRRKTENLIGWIKKTYRRAARAVRTLKQFFVLLWKTTTWNYRIWDLNDNVSEQQEIFNPLYFLQQRSSQSSCSVVTLWNGHKMV